MSFLNMHNKNHLVFTTKGFVKCWRTNIRLQYLNKQDNIELKKEHNLLLYNGEANKEWMENLELSMEEN